MYKKTEDLKGKGGPYKIMLSDSKKILEKLEGILHEDTQKQEKSIDLTVDKIMKMKGKGSLDFGGSEFKPSNLEEIKPEKKNKEDDYGWWTLDKGQYIIKYNEKITDDWGLIQPHPRLLKTGCSTSTQIIEGKKELFDLLTVGDKGVDIKENARVATLYKIE